MLDTETKTLWSHILGRAMEGPLKGSELKAIPADMVTWDAWRQAFPNTTVLSMPRTRQQSYTNEFYRNPRQFVFGFRRPSGVQHCSLETLMKRSILNIGGDEPLFISFDQNSTSVRIFKSTLDDGTVLTFVEDNDTLKKDNLKDEQTASVWNRVSGKAISGRLKGTQLAAHVGILSYAKVWRVFHPKSREVTRPANGRVEPKAP